MMNDEIEISLPIEETLYVSFSMLGFDVTKHSTSGYVITPEGEIYNPPASAFFLPDGECNIFPDLKPQAPNLDEIRTYPLVKKITLELYSDLLNLVYDGKYYRKGKGGRTSQGRDFGQTTLCLMENNRLTYWYGEAPDELFEVVQSILKVCNE